MPAESASKTPPEEFTMPIQGGMLEALGINMYTTLGKCLVEFIANAYDSDASTINITIPHEEIQSARSKVRAAAKAEVRKGDRDKFTILLEPLPEDLIVEIEDDGHGMSWEDIAEKYLPLNRKRRSDGEGNETLNKSESGKRFVMGRKGLGKLAGFGAAENVKVTSKRKGETYSTTIEMRDDVLKVAENVTEVPIPATYEDGLDLDSHFTRITLSGLKSDSVKERLETLKSAIAEAFYGVRPDDFAIKINGDAVVAEDPGYVVHYPETGRDADGFAEHSFEVEDIGEIKIRYFVGFRAAHVPARKRGARIYCNNRLAAGPSLFEMPTGMHSFHSTDYLECVVEADELDRAGVDFINTNRSQLREDTEVVRCLLTEVSDLMKRSVGAHAKYREEKAKKDLAADPTGKLLTQIVDTLPKRTQKNARAVLQVLAREFGVETEEFKELAPAIANSFNATDVLVRLIHLGSNPETIANIAEHLRELGEIERDDVLKLYRGRRNGIHALKELQEAGEAEWNKKGVENELHALLKENPWLIRPEYSQYLTSDQDMNKVVSKLAKIIKVDEFAKMKDGKVDDDTRPDLVFVMSDPMLEGPFILHVVELKTPTKALTIEHHRQLDDYIFKLKEWCGENISHPVSVRGYLIGAMPKAPYSADGQKHLVDQFKKQGAQSEIRIIGLTELVQTAWAIHIEAIRALEKAEAEAEADE